MQKKIQKRIFIFIFLILIIFVYSISRNNNNNYNNVLSLINIKPNDLIIIQKTIEEVNLKIIMPFHINQLQIVLENIAKWNIFKPCNRNTKDQSKLIELIFYIGYFNENNLINNLNKLPTKLECFFKITQVLHKYKSINELLIIKLRKY